MRRHVFALVTMPDKGWFTSCAIDAVNTKPGSASQTRLS